MVGGDILHNNSILYIYIYVIYISVNVVGLLGSKEIELSICRIISIEYHYS